MLSPMIFSLMIERLIRTALSSLRGMQWTLVHKLEILDFADDIAMLLNSFQHMQGKTDSLYTTARDARLMINAEKTKAMRINSRQKTPVHLGDQQIEDVG